MGKNIQTFQDVERYLASLPGRTRSFDDRLNYIRTCLAALGDPQDAVAAIHIAGTSGKGSTAYFSTALLVAAGYKVGMIVSPHVSSIAERSQINGSPLPEAEYVAYFTEFVALVESRAFEFTYIEFMTLFSYWLFAHIGVDYMVVEVGLGGRLDPTNVMTRNDKVCIITSIGFDHVEILGDTLGKIATEKAGIILLNNIVLSFEQDKEIMDVVRAATKKQAAKLIVEPPPTLSSKLQLPVYQQFNFALAFQAVTQRLSLDAQEPLTHSAQVIAQKISIPGRYERFKTHNQLVVLDGAHNTQKITALVESLQNEYGDNSLVAVVSFGKNKQDSIVDSVSELSKIAKHIVFTEFKLDFDGSIQATDIETLGTLAQTDVDTSFEADPYIAFSKARQLASKYDCGVLVTGSFYLVSNIRALLLEEY